MCTVTYETYTEESMQDGDMADCGWIHPGTERLRSVRTGCRRMYERNIRMARAGKFDWRLRDAVDYLAAQSFGEHEVEITDDGVRIVGRVAYSEAAYQATRQDAEIHVKCRAGSAERLAAGLRRKVRRSHLALIHNGTRFFWRVPLNSSQGRPRAPVLLSHEHDGLYKLQLQGLFRDRDRRAGRGALPRM